MNWALDVDRTRDPYFFFGLLGSLVGHLGLLLVMMLSLRGLGTVPPPIIYSVTLERGKSLGGVTQAPTKEESQLAPPKLVAAPSVRLDEKRITQVKETSTKPPKVEENAEVSLAEEKKAVPKKVEASKESAKKRDDDKKKSTESKASKPKEQEPSLAEIDKRLQAAMQRYLGESVDAGGKGFGAAALGGKGMGGGIQLPAEALAYRELLRSLIKQGWRWYDKSAPLLTRVSFEIATDGKISNVRIVQGSGNREYDDSVVRALYKASPVPPPPISVYQYFREPIMTFDPRD